LDLVAQNWPVQKLSYNPVLIHTVYLSFGHQITILVFEALRSINSELIFDLSYLNNVEVKHCVTEVGRHS